MTRPEDVRQDWDSGLISALDYLTRIRPLLTAENVDSVVDQMPQRVKNLFRRFAEGWVQLDKEVIEIGQGESTPDPPDLTATLALWLERNPE